MKAKKKILTIWCYVFFLFVVVNVKWKQFTAPLSTDPDVSKHDTTCIASFVRVEITTSHGVKTVELFLYPGVVDHEAKLTNAFIFDNFDLKWHANGRSYCGWPEHDASRCQTLRVVSLANIDEIIKYSVEKLEPPVITSTNSQGYMNVAPPVATFFDMCLTLKKTDISGDPGPIHRFIERLCVPAELVGRIAHSYGSGRYEVCVDRMFPYFGYLSSIPIPLETAGTALNSLYETNTADSLSDWNVNALNYESMQSTVSTDHCLSNESSNSYTNPINCKVMPLALEAVINACSLGRQVSLHDYKFHFEYGNMLNARRGGVPRFDPFYDEIEFPANLGSCGWIASRLQEACGSLKIPYARTEYVSSQPYKVYASSYSEDDLPNRPPRLVGGENSAFMGRT